MDNERFRLILGDCLEVMKTLADNSIDCVITDPPYGINENPSKIASRVKLAEPLDYGFFDWDKERVSADVFAEMKRISKHQIIFGGNYYTDYLTPSASWIIWDKLNSGDFADCEMAWTSHKKAIRKFSYMWNGMLKAKPETRFHPTQKPVDLMRWIVRNYTEPTDLILDPFAGAFTTGIACILEKRDFIGIEINPFYVELGEARIKRANLEPCDIPQRFIDRDLPLFAKAA